MPRAKHPDVTDFNDALHEVLARLRPDLVCLLGFLSPFELRGRYAGRALNVHPALIPAFSGKGFYGHHVHEAVLEKGVKVTGATVHFCSEEYDEGPILLQGAVPVQDDDTPDSLAARVQALERELVPEAIRLIAAGPGPDRGWAHPDRGRRRTTAPGALDRAPSSRLGPSLFRPLTKANKRRK